MKHIKWVIVSLVLFSLIGVPLSVSAADIGLVTESLSDEEMSDYLARNEFVEITSYTPLAATCFDVRDDHMVLIGANKVDTAVIAVYDDHGNFQYGFEKEKLGSFRVIWSGNDIAYYEIRSQLLFVINEGGEITDIFRVPSTTENSVYEQEVLSSATRKVGSSVYRMTNELPVADALPGSFKKIIRTDEAGTTTIYDATGNQRIRVIGGIVGFSVLLVLLAGGITIGLKKHCRKMQQQSAGDSN